MTKKFISGIPVRTTTVYPEKVWGLASDNIIVLFWEGAEIAKIERLQGAPLAKARLKKFSELFTGSEYAHANVIDNLGCRPYMNAAHP
jgi:hypothetical protein